MYYLIIHLKSEAHITEVLMALTENDATSTQIIQSRSAANLIAFDIPVFAGFREMFGTKSEQSQIICSFINHKEDVDNFLESLKLANIDFINDDIGEMFLLSLEAAFRKEE